jgi:glycosyltransferase involved in cell wall biosynthesis
VLSGAISAQHNTLGSHSKPTDEDRAKRGYSGVKILLILESVPSPDRSGADARISEFIRLLYNSGHALTFMTRFSKNDPRYLFELERYGKCLENGSRLADALKLEFNIVILPLWFWNYVSIPEECLSEIRTRSPNTSIVILTDDRHGYRQQLVAKLTGSFIDQELAEDFAQREATIYDHADAVITISATEQEYVNRLAPRIPVFTVPYSSERRVVSTTFAEREGLLFLADFNNQAGKDAAEWFLSRVWTIISSRSPKIHFTIAGNCSENLLRTNGRNVRSLGHIHDLTDVFNSHQLFVSPIRFGTGIATKNVLAMSYGLPVITTEMGAQSLGVHDYLIICDESPNEFACAVIDHYDMPSWWQYASAASLRHIDTTFSRSRAEESFKTVIVFLQATNGKPVTSDLCGRRFFPTCNYGVGNRSGLGQALLGESLLKQGDCVRAAARFRQALFYMRTDRSSIKPKPGYYARVLAGLEQCKTLAGDSVGANRCRTERFRYEETC